MSDDEEVQAKAYHNLGNTYLEQKKIQEAVQAYKNSMRLNPKDNETRYNLAKAMRQLQQQQQNQDQKQDDKKDQDKKDQQDQQKKDQQNQDQKNEDKGKPENEEKGDQQQQQQNKPEDKGEQGEQQQARKGEISREDAERLLEALSREEEDLQKKLNEEKIKTKPIKTDKDW